MPYKLTIQIIEFEQTVKYKGSCQEIADAAILLGVVLGIPRGYGPLIKFEHLPGLLGYD